jgi:pseudaminic acid biosynthesis-associated methylase
METEQQDFWEGEFGRHYTERNKFTIEGLDQLYLDRFGTTRTELNNQFLSGLDKNIRVLEVGCNRGIQLKFLDNMGFTDLWGIEISRYAANLALKEVKEANIIRASALNIPYKGNYFDLVFTSGVLIHIHPDDVPKAVDEIYRVSRKYIWGYEYFSEKCEELPYRGNENKLWRNNFPKIFMERHPDLVISKETKLKYKDRNSFDVMYLLEKKQ